MRGQESTVLCPCQPPLTSVAAPACIQDGPAYIQTFMQVLQNVSKEETVEYVLALMDELLTGQQHKENSTPVHHLPPPCTSARS